MRVRVPAVPTAAAVLSARGLGVLVPDTQLAGSLLPAVSPEARPSQQRLHGPTPLLPLLLLSAPSSTDRCFLQHGETHTLVSLPEGVSFHAVAVG